MEADSLFAVNPNIQLIHIFPIVPHKENLCGISFFAHMYVSKLIEL